MYISRRVDIIGPPVWKSIIAPHLSKSKLASLRPRQSERQQRTLSALHHHTLTPSGYLTAPSCTRNPSDIECDKYLGFILSPEGLRMDPAKVSMIQAWPVPRNVREVQSFLGFANFYQRFISGYAEFTQPLTNLCRKNTPWHFGEPESTAFQHLKTAFCAAPVE